MHLASAYGLDPSDLGSTFVQNGKTFRVDGLNPRRYKYPISVTEVKTGKKYKFREENVKMCY